MGAIERIREAIMYYRRYGYSWRTAWRMSEPIAMVRK